MGDWPAYYFPPLNVITPWHTPESAGAPLTGVNRTMNGAASATPGQNLVLLYGFRLWEIATAVKMSTITGATQNGNVDVGIYDGQFNRLVSTGSTALGVANTMQEYDITDTTMHPGLYYMAVQLSSATGTLFCASGGDEIMLGVLGLYTQSPAFGLPTTLSPALATGTTPFVAAMAVHFDTLV